MDFFNIISILVNLISLIGILFYSPLLYKYFKSKESTNISEEMKIKFIQILFFFTFLFIFLGSSLVYKTYQWCQRGSLKKEILSNIKFDDTYIKNDFIDSMSLVLNRDPIKIYKAIIDLEDDGLIELDTLPVTIHSNKFYEQDIITHLILLKK